MTTHETTKELLIRLVHTHGSTSFAGIMEATAARDLIDKNILRLASGHISPTGGSGILTAGPRIAEFTRRPQ